MKRIALISFLFLLISPVLAQYPTQTPTVNYPPPQYASGETFALVSVGRANLRSAPSTTTGLVVDIARYGDRFRIVGLFYPEENVVREVDSDDLVFDDPNEREVWFLVDTGAGNAWIYGGVVLISQPDGLPGTERTPTAEEQANLESQIAYAANSVGVQATLRVRSAPTTNSSVVGIIPYGERPTVIGRDEYGIWLYVSYGRTTGWISVYYIIPPPNYDLNAVPIIR